MSKSFQVVDDYVRTIESVIEFLFTPEILYFFKREE